MSEDVFRWVVRRSRIVACSASIGAGAHSGRHVPGRAEAQKAGKEAQTKIGPLVDRFGPLVDRFEAFLTSSTKMVEENRPRIADITAETQIIAKTAREQTERIAALIDDVNGRAKSPDRPDRPDRGAHRGTGGARERCREERGAEAGERG